MFKELLTAVHDVAHKLLHVILIPVVAVLEGAVALLTRFLTEISKV